jgi:hypothetical protein
MSSFAPAGPTTSLFPPVNYPAYATSGFPPAATAGSPNPGPDGQSTFVPTGYTVPGPAYTYPGSHGYNQQHLPAPSALRTPDGWISDPVWSTSQNPPSSWLASKLPRINLAPYDGDPRNWSHFIQNFKSLVHDVVPDDAQRIVFLKDYLTEKVRNSVANSLRDPAQYRAALEKLQRRYGNPQLIVRAHVQSLMQLTGPKDGDFDSLCVFSGAIQSAVADLSNGGHIHDLLAPGLLYQVTSKLPPELMQKWGEMMFYLQPKAATLIDFDQWLDSRVMAGTWAAPVFTSNSNRQRPKATRSREETTAIAVRPPKIFNTTQPAACALCSGTHPLENCPEFQKLCPKERAELVTIKKCCFRCLLPGHTSKGCSQENPCTYENCKSYHHPMMHGAPRVSWPPSTQLVETSA